MNVTLSKGGTGEKVVKLESLEIPDLWCLALSLPEPQKRAVLEVWHLAHDLKRELLELNEKWPQAQESHECKEAILATWHLAHDMHGELLEAPEPAERDRLKAENERLREALKECITEDGAHCLAYGTDTPKLRARLSQITNTAIQALNLSPKDS